MKKISKRPKPKNKKADTNSTTNTHDNIHDEFVRAVFAKRELVTEFLKFYVGKTEEGRRLLKLLDLRRIKLAPTQFFGQEGLQSIADLIFTIPLKNGQGTTGVVFIFEHKSQQTRSLPLQLLKYLASIWNVSYSAVKNPEEQNFVLPAPLLIVLHNGSKEIKNKPTLEQYVAKVDGTERFIPKFDYILVDLPVLNDDELGTAPLLRVILELLKRATDGTLYDVRKQILEPLAKIRNDKKTRYWIQLILRYLDEVLAKNHKKLTKKIIKEVLEPVYNKRSNAMALTMLEKIEIRGIKKGIKKGEARGIVKGRAKGRVEGRAEGKQEMLLGALQTRFKRVPRRVKMTIRNTSDPIILQSLLQDVFTSQTVAEFAKVLK
ncbi:MAG: Rpn family recombination-promoting nuclease/putative transposase [Planctomycetaceae bacterium]|jgi:hypothetical protein|nr:Rpn family recombination-promoting nuclease/putative transposase [Planctomycetaceae bacterium]